MYRQHHKNKSFEITLPLPNLATNCSGLSFLIGYMVLTVVTNTELVTMHKELETGSATVSSAINVKNYYLLL